MTVAKTSEKMSSGFEGEGYTEKYFASYQNDLKRQAQYKKELSRIESFVSSGQILDVGCGLGGFLDCFDSTRWKKYGVDVSEIAIEEARKKGIHVNNFENAYDYPDSFFDVIIFRGSIQLIPDPFAVLLKCRSLLKPNGLIVFLATPNSNSPYYKRFGTLPILTPHLNYLIPSDLMLTNILKNLGFNVARIHFPYIDGPYARPLLDHVFYLLSFFGLKKKFAFWKSVMEVYAFKRTEN
jgi:SAM-dependent methyltransferase